MAAGCAHHRPSSIPEEASTQQIGATRRNSNPNRQLLRTGSRVLPCAAAVLAFVACVVHKERAIELVGLQNHGVPLPPPPPGHFVAKWSAGHGADKRMHPRKLELARWQDLSDDVEHQAARGGLDEPSAEGNTRTQEDAALCAIPGMAEVLGDKCAGFNKQEESSFHGKQRHRPLMRVPSEGEEGAKESGNDWAGDRQETHVINHRVAGTAYPYERSSTVGELDEHLRGKLQDLRKLLDRLHGGEPRGGLKEPSSTKASTPTRREEDAGFCGIPIVADVFKHMCTGVNAEEKGKDAAVIYGKQRARPLYPIPVDGGGGSPLDGDSLSEGDDERRRSISEPVAGHSFPYEGQSPLGWLDRGVHHGARAAGDWLARWNKLSDTETRGGLDAAGERWVREDKDPWACGVPLLKELFGGYKCRGFVHDVGEVEEGKQQHRPLMPARESEEAVARERVREEGRRLRERAEAVDAAEDKMGRYYGSPPSLVIARQPKDRIVPAEGGQTQERSWAKLRQLAAWLRSILPGFPAWEWWVGKGPAAPCGKDDIACGADLTLHPPHPPELPTPAPRLAPLAGTPIGPGFHGLGQPVPCLHPFCDSPHVGEPKAPREAQRRMRSIFAGKPIGPSNAGAAGEPVPCLHPFCDSTASLHKPIAPPPKPHETRFVPFTAGYPIAPRAGKGTGGVVPCVGPYCNSAPYIGGPPPSHNRRGWRMPFAGKPIGPGVHSLGAPVPLSDEGFHFRSPFAGQPVGTEPEIKPWNHKGSYTYPGAKGWGGAKGKGEHIGGLEDVHYPAGSIRPWMFRQVYPGQQLRRVPSEGEAGSEAERREEEEVERGEAENAEAERGGEERRSGEAGGAGAEFGALKSLLKGVWQVPPRDIASAAI